VRLGRNLRVTAPGKREIVQPNYEKITEAASASTGGLVKMRLRKEKHLRTTKRALAQAQGCEESPEARLRRKKRARMAKASRRRNRR